jgi:hypothetical protein
VEIYLEIQNREHTPCFVALACVTNPTATGRFLIAGSFTGSPLIFPNRTGAVQN